MAQAYAAWGTATCRKTHETGREIGIYHSELLFPFSLDHAGYFVHCCLSLGVVIYASSIISPFDLLFSHIDNPLLLRPKVGPVCSILSIPVPYVTCCLPAFLHAV